LKDAEKYGENILKKILKDAEKYGEKILKIMRSLEDVEDFERC